MKVLKGNCKIYKSAKFEGYNLIENSKIGENCYVFSSKLKNCILEDDIIVINSVLEDCEIKKGTKIGPFCYVRNNSKIGENCRIGDFVEIKNSVIKNKTKASHHAYIGDAFVGENCNIGCGAIFANYNGKIKQKIFVGDNCFIGANVTLVAPLNIKNDCFVGAGTVVRKDLDEKTFVVDITNNKHKKIT
ncbi:MAG: hypothetical protein IJ837_03865 [Clostridia bacterium]|nr:hypothetical protein [Clostridia bacterium]